MMLLKFKQIQILWKPILQMQKKAIEEVQDAYLLSLHTDVTEANTVGSEESPITLNKNTIL